VVEFEDKTYLAPEIISNNLISPKNDIFSLGLVLYELMTISHKVAPVNYATFDFDQHSVPTFYSQELQDLLS